MGIAMMMGTGMMPGIMGHGWLQQQCCSRTDVPRNKQ
jgi:hypothetical protein